jgi:hypothetical protein
MDGKCITGSALKFEPKGRRNHECLIKRMISEAETTKLLSPLTSEDELKNKSKINSVLTHTKNKEIKWHEFAHFA